ncbi:MAG: sigma-70 family RNA polymerase sigma factor [Polyangiaceae bacterium]
MAASGTELEAHRSALTGHCYRMMGSVVDAEDAVQETLVRAWKALDGFDGRSSLGTWLYRIATNVCLDHLAQRKRRHLPVLFAPQGFIGADLGQLPHEHWIEPLPDASVVLESVDPAEIAELRQSIRLAFVAALQELPARQRAVLLLVEVLGWSAAEIADSLEMSVAAVNSALQRARATLVAKAPTPAPSELTAEQAALVERYAEAFERYDVDQLAALLHEDATLSMPPLSLWLRGAATIREWQLGPGSGCRGSRLLPTRASGVLAFGQYRPDPDGGHAPWALIVPEVVGDRIASVTSFLDTKTLFPRFNLPSHLSP